ncbi:MAG: D-aminoacyl-tRNA deacylase [Flavobacteriaceae bacterium]|nr:D-aminoacyl-tRNA deacylase [Flavobacteriaceae bacterium]
MKIVIQRVLNASVEVENNIVGKINQGLLLLVGIEENDAQEDVNWLAKKVVDLRIFSDDKGKMNLSVKDIQGEILCVSQFTLIADYKKGNRPSFIRAARPEQAIPLFEYFKELLRQSNLKIESGVFGADMKVQLLNDGPVTIVMDSQTKI